MIRNNHIADLAKLIEPLTANLETLNKKVDLLMADRITRAEVEQKFKDVITLCVSRSEFEPRQTAILDHAARQESDFREFKHQSEDRFKEQAEALLSARDRIWMRAGQVAGWIALLLSALEFLSHIHFQ